MTKPAYRYTESGLDHVFIEGIDIVVDDSEDEVFCVPNINGLHKAISESIITRTMSMTGDELKFLRTEVGLTQEHLAKIIQVSRATINRWETGRNTIDPNAEFVIRMLVSERLEIPINLSVQDLASRCVWKVKRENIRIDGSNPKKYQALAA